MQSEDEIGLEGKYIQVCQSLHTRPQINAIYITFNAGMFFLMNERD